MAYASNEKREEAILRAKKYSAEKDIRILAKLKEFIGRKLNPVKVREIFRKEGLLEAKVEYCLRSKYDYIIYNCNDRCTIYHVKTKDDRTIINIWLAGIPENQQ